MRLAVYAVLIVIALAAIKLIDDRAMLRMAQLENASPSGNTPKAQP